MGIYHECYAEAKINGAWRGIDLYVHGPNDKFVPIPMLEGKSNVGSMLQQYTLHYSIGRDTLSPELRQDHAWLFKGSADDEMWLDGCVSVMSGEDVDAKDVSLPEYAGFVSKDVVLSYKKGEVDEIYEWMRPDDFKELPEDVRKGYEWFEWTDPYGDQANFARMKRELQRRVNWYNLTRYYWPYSEIPPEITMKDTRVVIISS